MASITGDAGSSRPPSQGGISPQQQILLAEPGDEKWLTDILCLVRCQIEYFPATADDVEAEVGSRKGGVKDRITEGRVGIRCIHCAGMPLLCRAKGAASYPLSTGLVYQAVRNWQRCHLPACHYISDEVRATAQGLPKKHSGNRSNRYWIESCKRKGLVDAESPEEGIRFADGGLTHGGGGAQPVGAASSHDATQSADTVAPEDALVLREEMSNPRHIVLHADLNSNDVLCGRGIGFYEYSGCVLFRELIYERLEEYHECKSIKVKNRLAKEVLDCIRSQSDPPGRFLSLAAGSPDKPEKWRVVDEKAVREKVKQAFRSQKKVAIKGEEHTEVTVWEEAGPPPSLLPMFLPLDAVGAKSPSDGQASTEEMPPFAGLRGVTKLTHRPTICQRNGNVADKAGHEQEDQNEHQSPDVSKPTLLPPSGVSSDLEQGQESAFTEEHEQQERATLSPNDIASAEADLRGLTSGIADLLLGRKKEEEQLMASGLARLEAELEKIPTSNKRAYLQAVSKCPDLVSNDHKVAFLEHEDYDGKLAAERLARYWEFKHKMFGPEKCFLPLTLLGAMKDEVPGLVKYCPFHVSANDTSGRAVIFINPSRLDLSKYSTNSTLRALWYIIEAATEEPEVRRRGIIELFYVKNITRKHFDPDFPRTEKALFRDILPLQCRAIHICHPNPVLYYVIHPIAKFFLGKELRLRIKMHYGSDEEVLSDLEGYCLPRSVVPCQLGGDFDLDHEKWVHNRFLLEARRSNVALPLANAGVQEKVSEEGACSDRSSSFRFSTSNHTEVTLQLSQGVMQEKKRLSEEEINGVVSKRRARTESANDQPFMSQHDNPTSSSDEEKSSFDTAADSDHVGGRVERRDSFYESIMELPGIEELSTKQF